MPWCPHCKKQQPPGSVCPDCGAPLLTVLHGSDANEPVLLTTISNEDQLELLTSQITAVTDQYSQSLLSGLYTPESYQEYLNALDAAGVQDYLDAVQSQLDAWLATQ